MPLLSRRMQDAQTPIVPWVGELVHHPPGAISPGQGVVDRAPPAPAPAAPTRFCAEPARHELPESARPPGASRAHRGPVRGRERRRPGSILADGDGRRQHGLPHRWPASPCCLRAVTGAGAGRSRIAAKPCDVARVRGISGRYGTTWNMAPDPNDRRRLAVEFCALPFDAPPVLRSCCARFGETPDGRGQPPGPARRAGLPRLPGSAAARCRRREAG